MARRIRSTTSRRPGIRDHLERVWQAKVDQLHPQKGDELPPPYPRLLTDLRAGRPVSVPAFTIRDYLPPGTDPASRWIVAPDDSTSPDTGVSR